MRRNFYSRIKTAFIVILSVIALSVTGILLYNSTEELRSYNKGEKLLAEGNYSLAAKVFHNISGYKDSAEKYSRAVYSMAELELENEKYEDAAMLYLKAGAYSDSEEKVKECHYKLAELCQEDSPEKAIDFYTLAAGYEDAEDRKNSLIYSLGHRLFIDGKYNEAQEYFDILGEKITDYGYYHFKDIFEAEPYIRFAAENLYDVIEFIIVDDSAIKDEDGNIAMEIIYNMVPLRTASVGYNPFEDTVFISPVYFPGNRISYAHKSGDMSFLSDEEKEIYDTALVVSDNAKKECSNIYELEKWIYDYVCRNVYYDSPDMDVDIKEFLLLEELTCIGAFNNGRANCQGYADMFYLLCSLCDIEVRKVSGEVDGISHTWNAVSFDGEWYFVDTVYGDRMHYMSDTVDYGRFNVGWDKDYYFIEGDERLYSWISETESEHTYYTENNLVFDSPEDAAVALCDQFAWNGQMYSYASVIDGDLSADEVYTAMYTEMISMGLDTSYLLNVSVDSYGGRTQILVVWR